MYLLIRTFFLCKLVKKCKLFCSPIKSWKVFIFQNFLLLSLWLKNKLLLSILVTKSLTEIRYAFNPYWCAGRSKRTYLFFKDLWVKNAWREKFGKNLYSLQMSRDGYKAQACTKAKTWIASSQRTYRPPFSSGKEYFHFCNRRLASLSTGSTRSHVTLTTGGLGPIVPILPRLYSLKCLLQTWPFWGEGHPSVPLVRGHIN